MKKTGHREIFIFLAGSTPQVITETIYALGAKQPAVHPDELYIITTAVGRKRVEADLIKKGILKRLAEEYGLPPLALREDSFVVPVDDSGRPFDDIKDGAENEAMGDLITSFIREKAKDQATRLHCSLAGGRKTMSFYLGAALQLFGRPWDRLYHVLVTPEFESHPEFFYKPAKDTFIEHNGKRLNTSEARIILADLPFIRLRSKLSLDGSRFRELVEEGQREIDIALVQPELRVRLSEKTVQIGSKTIKLQPLHLMIYAAYLRYKVNSCKYPARPYCLDCAECFPALLKLTTKPALEEMAKDYLIICRSRVGDLLYKYKDGLTTELIRQAISKIRKAMSEQLGDETAAAQCSITTSLRGYGDTRHGVRVEKGKIRIK